ncbi:MAG: sigma-70 family RNA polymerase sigma factor [Candidatus Acidiferrum sp.]
MEAISSTQSTGRFDVFRQSIVNTRVEACVLYNGMMTAIGSAQSGTRVDSRLTIKDCRTVTAAPGPEPSADSSLVLAARAGDRAAFGALYARYARMVHGILLAKVPATDVEDLVQDVFLRALPRLCDLRHTERFGPWLAAITRNRANDYHRQSRSLGSVRESLSEDEELPASSTALDAEAATILAFVRSLPDAYRETLILRLVEGMTGPEIAAHTGLTPGSVRVNLHRGMKQLREKLTQTSRDGAIRLASGAAGNSSPHEKNAPRRRNQP